MSSELRLCYYANSAQPRAWIRCPAVTNPNVLTTRPLSLAPIYSSKIKLTQYSTLKLIFLGGSDTTMDAVFDVKKLEARLMALLDQKIDDNKKMMERLNRLSLS